MIKKNEQKIEPEPQTIDYRRIVQMNHARRRSQSSVPTNTQTQINLPTKTSQLATHVLVHRKHIFCLLMGHRW